MHFYRKCWFNPFEEQFISSFLSDCPSLMLGIAIHCIQHSQAMFERGLCELAHSFFHFTNESVLNIMFKCIRCNIKWSSRLGFYHRFFNSWLYRLHTHVLWSGHCVLWMKYVSTLFLNSLSRLLRHLAEALASDR